MEERRFKNVGELQNYWIGKDKEVSVLPCGCAKAWELKEENEMSAYVLHATFCCIYHGGSFLSNYTNIEELSILEAEYRALEQKASAAKKALERAEARGLMTKNMLIQAREVILNKLTIEERELLGFKRPLEMQ